MKFFLKIQYDIDNLFKGLKALRKKIIQTMDTKINSYGIKLIRSNKNYSK